MGNIKLLFVFLLAVLIVGCSSSDSNFSYGTGESPGHLNRCFGGDGNDYCLSVCVAPDGIIWVTGHTDSPVSGDIKNYHGGILDLWLLGIDPKNNTIVYNRCFGGEYDESGSSVFVAPDGTVWVTGDTNSPVGGDIKNRQDTVSSDLWLLGIDGSNESADPIYNRCFGGDATDIGNSVCVALDGTVWVAGRTSSPLGGDIKNRQDTVSSDIWLLGIDGSNESADPIYNRCFGGDAGDLGSSVCVAPDGAVWVAGRTYSPLGGDIKNRRGTTDDLDLWLLGIEPNE